MPYIPEDVTPFHRLTTFPENTAWICGTCCHNPKADYDATRAMLLKIFPDLSEKDDYGEWVETIEKWEDTSDLTCDKCDSTGMQLDDPEGYSLDDYDDDCLGDLDDYPVSNNRFIMPSYYYPEGD